MNNTARVTLEAALVSTQARIAEQQAAMADLDAQRDQLAQQLAIDADHAADLTAALAVLDPTEQEPTE